MSYTKGPWIVVDGGICDKELVITTQERLDAPKVHICEMDVFFTEPFEAEQRANAHLIAAAPELLEALEDILFDSECPARRASAIAAVAKAKGE